MEPKSKILILSAYSENRVVDDYGRNDWAEVSMEVNKKYAEKHGYSFECIEYRGDDLLDGFWATWLKIDVILKHLSSYDYVCWIDADAIFSTDEPLDFLFGKDISIMKETPAEGFAQTLTMTTTGFMLFKNTAFSKMVLESLLKQSGEWDNGSFKTGRWHEQGLMDEMFVIPQVIQTYRFDSSYYKLVNRSVEDISACFETNNFLIFPSKLQTADVDDVHFVFHAKGGSINKKDRIEKVCGEKKDDKVNFNMVFDVENGYPKVYASLIDDVRNLATRIYYRDLGTGLTIYHSTFTFESKGISFYSTIYADMNFLDGLRVDVVDISTGKLIYSEDKIYRSINKKIIHSDINDTTWCQYGEVFHTEDYKYSSVIDRDKVIKVEAGDICVDIGANYGFFSMYAIEQGAEKVYAIEACSKIGVFLEKNVKDKNIEVIYKAVGNKTGERKFCISDTSSGGNHLEDFKIEDGRGDVETVEVDGIHINDFLSQYKVDHIDFLKVDCEGGEYEIFEAIDDDYLRNNVKKIVGEYHHSYNGERDKLLDKLRRCGFECEYYYPQGVKEGYVGYFAAWKNNEKRQINKNNSIDKFLEDSCVSNIVENKNNNNRCYVLFCDQKYYQYMKNVLTLLDEFSEYKVLAYTVNFLPTDHFKNVTFKRVNDDNLFEYQTTGKNYLIKDNWDKNMYMCFNKIRVIIESLKTDFDEFVYLDVDTFPTQNINDIFEIARKGLDYPILPRYEHEIMVYGDRGNPIVEDGYDETKTLEWWLIEKLGLIGKYERTHYRQSCFFYYNKKCKSFWEECCKIISNDEIFKNQNEFFGDESIINVLLWERSGVEYFDEQHIKHIINGDQFKTLEKVDDFFRELQNNDKLWLLHGKVYKYFFKELLLSDHQYDEVESEKINNYFVNKIFDNEKYKENLLGKVLINFDSKSLGDNIAWMPYAEEFRKKHNCKVVLSTFWNHLFEKEYPEIEFISPGTVVYNINGQYNIGWYFPWDPNKNPNDFRTISLQQTASDILGLEYKEIKPKITIP